MRKDLKPFITFKDIRGGLGKLLTKSENQRFEVGGLSVERNLTLGSRCKWEVQAKLGRPIHYQANIFWGSSKIDGLGCKPFH